MRIWFKKIHERILKAVIFAVAIPLVFAFSLSPFGKGSTPKEGGISVFSSIFDIPTAQAAGVPQILSYQGRLTDSSGTLLGSASGTSYYFKFSIYDAVSGGTKLWPSSAPASTSASVVSGVFNVGIGDTGAGYPDTLDLNFEDDEEVYLQVEVASSSSGTYETISPRQRITSAGYAINSKALRGFVPSQVASGSNVPVLSGGNLTLGGTNPQINATSSNDLVIQGGAGTGDLILATNGGRVGVGTDSPSSTLHVVYSANSSANGLFVENTNTGSGAYTVLSLKNDTAFVSGLLRTSAANTSYTGVGSSLLVYQDAAKPIGFVTSNAQRMIIDASGNVGIGTTAPSSTLHVVGDFRVSSTAFYVSSTSGYVGIGTTSPGHKLEVAGDIWVSAAGNKIAAGDINNYFWRNSAIGGGATEITYPIGGMMAFSPSNFGTAGTASMVINNGNVGIGTTAPSSTLHVVGTSQFSATSTFAGNVGINNTSPGARLTIGTSALALYDTTLPGGSGDEGYLFNNAIPSGLFNEVSGSILSLGINTPQVGTRDTNTVGGIFRLDTRTGIGGTAAGEQSFIVYGYPTGGSVATPRLVVNLQDGNTLLAQSSGSVGIGTTAPSSTLHVVGTSRFSATSTFAGNVGIGTTTPSSLFTVATSTDIMTVAADGSVVVGAPTGGAKGYGTINAQAVYDDNTLLTDYVFDLQYDGALKPEDVELYGDYEMLSITELEDYIRNERHLPGIRGRDEWDTEGKPSIGQLLNGVWRNTEEFAIYITELNSRVAILEALNGGAAGDALAVRILSVSEDLSVAGAITAAKLIADEVKTQKLCLDDLCITKDQLRALLERNDLLDVSEEPAEEPVSEPVEEPADSDDEMVPISEEEPAPEEIVEEVVPSEPISSELSEPASDPATEEEAPVIIEDQPAADSGGGDSSEPAPIDAVI